MIERDPWDAGYPLASLGLPADEASRRGGFSAFVLAGLLFAALALVVVAYAVFEREARVSTPVYLTGASLGPSAYLVPPPGS